MCEVMDRKTGSDCCTDVATEACELRNVRACSSTNTKYIINISNELNPPEIDEKLSAN